MGTHEDADIVWMGEADAACLAAGWHGVENWPPLVRWTTERAIARLRRSSLRAGASFGMRAFAGPCEARGRVAIDGRDIGAFTIPAGGAQTVELPLGDETHGVGGSEPVEVTIVVDTPFVPADLDEQTQDGRTLGVAVEVLSIGPPDLQASQFGYETDRLAYREAANGLPIPPVRLNHLVSGTRSVPWYVKGGKLAFDAILDCLERNGVQPAGLYRVLDFGCGSGRVIRYWHDLPSRVHGTDYNQELIDWCRDNLPVAEFGTNRLAPPTDYADNTFDLIYGLSVFTHLDASNQVAWMRELRRILRPGGYLYVTTHGDDPSYLDTFDAAELARFHDGELVVRLADSEGTNLCMAYHPRRYFETLAAGFDIVDHVPQGAKGNPAQDANLLRKR